MTGRRFYFLLLLLYFSLIGCECGGGGFTGPEKLSSTPKDTFLSFGLIGKIGIVVQDTSSLDPNYEQEVYDMFYEAGMNVVKIDTTSMDAAIYDASGENWSDLALVVLCFGTDSAAVDTSIENGIGDVPVIIMEPGYWLTFGFPDSSGTTAEQDSFVVNGTEFLSNFVSDGDTIDVYGVGGGDTTYYAILPPTYDSNAWLLTLDGADTVAVYDTLNGVERIAWGMPVSANFRIQSVPFLGEGWTLFNRGAAELTNANEDSLFTLLYVARMNSSDWQRSGPFLTPYILDRLTLNGHDVWVGPYDSVAAMQPTYEKQYSDFDGVVLYETFVSNKTLDSLTTNIGKIFAGYLSEWWADSLGLATNMTRLTTTDTFIVKNSSHLINNFLSVNDTIQWINVNSSNADGDVTANAIELAQDEDGKGVQFAHKSEKYTMLGYPVTKSSGFLAPDTAFHIFDRAMGWLFTTLPTPPSGVTLTTLSKDSVKVEWTDNSSSEGGYCIYLYSPVDVVVSCVAADVVADTLTPFWPPNSEVIADVAVVSGADTIFSSTGRDTTYTSVVTPPEVRVIFRADTLLNFLINSPLFEDKFQDGDFTASPAWTEADISTAGTGVFSEDTVHNRIVFIASNQTGSAARLRAAFSDVGGDSTKDMEWSFNFKLSDTSSVDAATQIIAFFPLNDSLDFDDNEPSTLAFYEFHVRYTASTEKFEYLAYFDGSDVISGVNIDIESFFKWHNYKVKRDVDITPADTSIVWTFYFDGDSVAAYTEPNGDARFASSYTGFEVFRGTGIFIDDVTVQHTRPSANHDSTHYAVNESNSGGYVTDVGDSLSSTLTTWRTYAEWGAAAGDSLSGLTPNTSYDLRSKARTGRE